MTYYNLNRNKCLKNCLSRAKLYSKFKFIKPISLFRSKSVFTNWHALYNSWNCKNSVYYSFRILHTFECNSCIREQTSHVQLIQRLTLPNAVYHRVCQCTYILMRAHSQLTTQCLINVTRVADKRSLTHMRQRSANIVFLLNTRWSKRITSARRRVYFRMYFDARCMYATAIFGYVIVHGVINITQLSTSTRAAIQSHLLLMSHFSA